MGHYDEFYEAREVQLKNQKEAELQRILATHPAPKPPPIPHPTPQQTLERSLTLHRAGTGYIVAPKHWPSHDGRLLAEAFDDLHAFDDIDSAMAYMVLRMAGMAPEKSRENPPERQK